MNGEALVATVQEVEIDWTRVADYSRLVREEIEEYSNIEVTEDLREGGIHAQKAWAFWFNYLSERIWKTSLTTEIVQFCRDIGGPRILSLGCGYGGVELSVAQLLNLGYQMTAVDLNPSILSKARTEAEAKNLDIQFLPLDLNFLAIKEKSFDLVIAHASLHHLLNLEHVFSQIHRCLNDNGRLIVQDVIGKTQVLFWKENVDFAIELVRKMPPRYNAGIALSKYSEPSIQIGMEGIRQEEIENLLNRYFTPIKMFKYGSFMRMICTHPHLGKRFDPDVEADRLYLQDLFELDVRQVEEGTLRPTEMLAVYEKRLSVDFDKISYEGRARLNSSFPIGKRVMKLVMDDYDAWESSQRTRSAGTFATSTLRALEEIIPVRIENSAETGCGKSTILFSNIAEHHTVFAFDDRAQGSGSSVLFYEQCPLTRMDRITLVPGPTQRTLPAYDQHRPLDLLLIDGPHGYPFPEMEYYWFYPHLRPGAFLILDDVGIPTIGNFATFLSEEPMFTFVTLLANNTAIFRRTDAPTFDPLGDGWWTQIYNRRRVSPQHEAFLADGPMNSFTKSADNQIELLNLALSERNAQIDHLRLALADHDLTVTERDMALAKIEEIFASRSWRFTAPTRGIAGLLRRFARPGRS